MVFASLVCGSAGAADYAVVVSESAWGDPGWRVVAEGLQQKHQGEVVSYAERVEEALPKLQSRFPKYVCFVQPPRQVTRAFVSQVRRLVRELDGDPYPDCRWGILTGYDSENALRIARHGEPLVVRKVGSGTPLPLDFFEEGVWYSELNAGQIGRKRKGQPFAEEKGPQDSTQGLVDCLNQFQPDLFVTSGHATERDWQIGYRYQNGYFRCAHGALYGEDTAGKRLPVASPNPKVYLAVGNCLMGHINGLDAMALAFLNSAGVHQMLGYTVDTWYGYAGWGALDYFVEQPGRFNLAETVVANDAALVHRLLSYFPELMAERLNLDRPTRPAVAVSEAARAAGLSAQDGFGLLYDRDAVAFYGDPAWEARLAPQPGAWEQSLSESGGKWVFEVQPRMGERSFDTMDKNGSQRGGRPFFHFLPHRIGNARVVEGAELNPVITDDFILVPKPRTCDPARTYRVVFEASAR